MQVVNLIFGQLGKESLVHLVPEGGKARYRHGLLAFGHLHLAVLVLVCVSSWLQRNEHLLLHLIPTVVNELLETV